MSKHNRDDYDSAPHDELLSRLREILADFEWTPAPEPPRPKRRRRRKKKMVTLPSQPERVRVTFDTPFEPMTLAEVPVGFFTLADFLCDRVDVPHGTLVDDDGFADALFGCKPGTRRHKRKKAA